MFSKPSGRILGHTSMYYLMSYLYFIFGVYPFLFSHFILLLYFVL